MIERAHGEEAAVFLIDVNGHHETQMERVRQEARVLAQRARLFKHDVEMPPLSSYERLVVHEMFAEDPEIDTESAGEGKFRHIVLKYKNKA
jgi:spoIIIJ-associated protein